MFIVFGIVFIWKGKKMTPEERLETVRRIVNARLADMGIISDVFAGTPELILSSEWRIPLNFLRREPTRREVRPLGLEVRLQEPGLQRVSFPTAEEIRQAIARQRGSP